MQIIAFFEMLGTLATGILAAVYWLRASKVPIDYNGPKWPNGWPIESGDPVLHNMNWTTATMQSVREAGRLNAIAARWTAASVVLGAVPGLAKIVAGWLGLH